MKNAYSATNRCGKQEKISIASASAAIDNPQELSVEKRNRSDPPVIEPRSFGSNQRLLTPFPEAPISRAKAIPISVSADPDFEDVVDENWSVQTIANSLRQRDGQGQVLAITSERGCTAWQFGALTGWKIEDTISPLRSNFSLLPFRID